MTRYVQSPLFHLPTPARPTIPNVEDAARVYLAAFRRVRDECDDRCSLADRCDSCRDLSAAFRMLRAAVARRDAAMPVGRHARIGGR